MTSVRDRSTTPAGVARLTKEWTRLLQRTRLKQKAVNRVSEDDLESWEWWQTAAHEGTGLRRRFTELRYDHELPAAGAPPGWSLRQQLALRPDLPADNFVEAAFGSTVNEVEAEDRMFWQRQPDTWNCGECGMPFPTVGALNCHLRNFPEGTPHPQLEDGLWHVPDSRQPASSDSPPAEAPQFTEPPADGWDLLAVKDGKEWLIPQHLISQLEPHQITFDHPPSGKRVQVEAGNLDSADWTHPEAETAERMLAEAGVRFTLAADAPAAQVIPTGEHLTHCVNCQTAIAEPPTGRGGRL